MRLRSKALQTIQISRLSRVLLTNLAVIGLAASVAIFAALSSMIAESYGELEKAEVARNADRVHAVLGELVESNSAHSKDWAIWDDAYNYIENFNRKFEIGNINAESFKNAQVECMAFVRFDKVDARNFCFDLESAGRNDNLTVLFSQVVEAAPFVAWAKSNPSATRFEKVGTRLYALAVTHILRSDGSGNPNGFIVFLERVEEQHLTKALQFQGRIDFEQLSDSTEFTPSEDRVEVAVPVRGSAQTIAMVRFDIPRNILAAGQRLRNLTLLVVILLLIGMLALLRRRLATLVLDPVERMHGHVAQIRRNGELSTIEGPIRNDEIGALQQEFNGMALELLSLRERYEAQSFALGKSQSAIGAMHNVRNSLSPVNVILSTLEKQLAGGVPPEARRALAELTHPDTPQGRRERLVDYLGTIHDELEADFSGARMRTREAGRNLAAALEAIASNQNPEFIDYDEACIVAGLLGHAGNAARFVHGVTIEVSIDCPERVIAKGNRILLGQVFENLATNAVEAILARGAAIGSLGVTVAQKPDVGRCLITIRDDGEGFDNARAEQMFERGFSTRTEKSGGLGLHWCSNTINAMGGTLALHSDGPGSGAVATITLIDLTNRRLKAEAA